MKGYGVDGEGKRGLGQYLCDLGVGEKLNMMIKSPRRFFDQPFEHHLRSQLEVGRNTHQSEQAGKWNHLCFICCGTGIAPFFQLIRCVLQQDYDTAVSLIFCNKAPRDILMKDDLLLFAATNEKRYRQAFLVDELSTTVGSQSSNTQMMEGRITAEMINCVLQVSKEQFSLADAIGDTTFMVCGTDHFLETVCGNITRITETVVDEKGLAKKKKRKVQGDVKGLLASLQVLPSQLFKF